MNSWPLGAKENANLTVLRELGLPYSLVFLTATGLNKSILDATAPVRLLLCEAGIHDYELQGQGQQHKVISQAVFLGSGLSNHRMSLYRPETKNGDPRFWVHRLPDVAGAGDVLLMFAWRGMMHLVNLSRSNLASIWQDSDTQAVQYLKEIRNTNNQTATQLLGLLRGLAKRGPLPAVCQGDTAIGRTVETALGIPMNSSPTPDFNGIELKTSRLSKTRQTLFACVPDWTLSKVQSSRNMLERFGRVDGEELRLYCTVSAKGANTHGLQLQVRGSVGHLLEQYCKPTPVDVLVWRLERLHEKFVEKHKETFWIKANSHTVKGRETFELLSVTHTKTPNLPAFDQMLIDGDVTVDHLIKGRLESGAHERGPLFKVDRRYLSGLFTGDPVEYSLR